MTSNLSKTLSNQKQPKTRPKADLTRVMVFGTFDVMHKGHDDFFRQARTLVPNSFLIVSVARDRNVVRVKSQAPLYGERKRLSAVKGHRLVDKAVLSAVGDHIPHIVRQRPRVIALGYDQRNYVKGLTVALKKAGLAVKIVRLKPFKPDLYKSSIIKKMRNR